MSVTSTAHLLESNMSWVSEQKGNLAAAALELSPEFFRDVS